MAKVTLRNTFHNTTCTVSPRREGELLTLSPRQVKRAWKELCGRAGCTCGDFMGCRGPQGAEFEPTPDGGAIARARRAYKFGSDLSEIIAKEEAAADEAEKLEAASADAEEREAEVKWVEDKLLEADAKGWEKAESLEWGLCD